MNLSVERSGRRAGWSDTEANLLWETADEAQQQGLPLKAVFERIAGQTGRRPNSIRNYYYAQVQKREGGQEKCARFVPFTEPEVEKLMEQVLRARAQGHSVRSCLQRISGGDHSLMLRYQNKYRAIIKSRPEMVDRMVDKLRTEGVNAEPPSVNHRPRTTLSDACDRLISSAAQGGDAELVRAVEIISRALVNGSNKSAVNVRLDLYRMALDERQEAVDQLIGAAGDLIMPIKEYLAQNKTARAGKLDAFCSALSDKIGILEAKVQQSQPQKAN